MTFVVVSYWVHRPKDFPDAPDYLSMLKALDRSCRRLGLAHVVVTDQTTKPFLGNGDITAFATDLPRNLMKATTEAHARWLEHDHRGPVDTLFVGADCLVQKDPRGHIPEGDLAIVLRPGHKRHRINNGFMYIPDASRKKVAPLYRRIANNCGGVMCDDMVAVEEVLKPMPFEYGPCERAGLKINFVPMNVWNGGPRRVEKSSSAYVLHFRGHQRKGIMLDWAARWL